MSCRLTRSTNASSSSTSKKGPVVASGTVGPRLVSMDPDVAAGFVAVVERLEDHPGRRGGHRRPGQDLSPEAQADQGDRRSAAARNHLDRTGDEVQLTLDRVPGQGCIQAHYVVHGPTIAGVAKKPAVPAGLKRSRIAQSAARTR